MMNREHSYYDVNKDNNMIKLIIILYELHNMDEFEDNKCEL